MNIVVTGATGNVGTALVRALVDDDQVTEIVGIARRVPEAGTPRKVRWVAADVSRDPLQPHFSGLHARPRRLPRAVVRGLVQASYLARLHPVSPGWLDLQ